MTSSSTKFSLRLHDLTVVVAFLSSILLVDWTHCVDAQSPKESKAWKLGANASSQENQESYWDSLALPYVVVIQQDEPQKGAGSTIAYATNESYFECQSGTMTDEEGSVQEECTFTTNEKITAIPLPDGVHSSFEDSLNDLDHHFDSWVNRYVGEETGNSPIPAPAACIQHNEGLLLGIKQTPNPYRYLPEYNSCSAEVFSSPTRMIFCLWDVACDLIIAFIMRVGFGRIFALMCSI